MKPISVDQLMKEEIIEEYNKCIESPYYFAMKYLIILVNGKTIRFTTTLTEDEFNKFIKEYGK